VVDDAPDSGAITSSAELSEANNSATPTARNQVTLVMGESPV
jgi:hypothetical protein